jgi:hypothetical protein
MYGGVVTGEQWAAIKREIRAARSAAACTTPANRFALLPTDSGDVYVELDGCKRIMAPTASGRETLRQASPALLALLAER